MNSQGPATGSRWTRLACYFPLIAIALQIAWVFVLFLGLIFTVGDTPYVNTPEKSHAFGLLCSLPVGAGVVVGILAMILRWPTRILDWICLIAGTLACAALFYGCVR